MTTVFYREYYDRYLLIVEGHASFSEKGKDIVCSAVSILVYTLLNMLKDEESDKRLKLKREIVRDGYLCVEIEPFDFSKNRTKGIIDTVVMGLALLNQEYPENVRLE
ncbi:MAG: ribosomal-processing cysteine protease Prp [Clostridia bacterium]|nr:ribosomal-processing cysteine protease Prp [Clostridia bacterium]